MNAIDQSFGDRVGVIQLGFSRRHAEYGLRTRRDKLVPGNLPGALLELEESSRLEPRHPHQYATRRPEPEIRAHHGARVPFPGYAAVLNPRPLAQRVQLLRDERLQPGRGDGEASIRLGSQGETETLRDTRAETACPS